MSLLDAAKSVRLNAHAPYSGFKVGAALRAEDGRIFVGCNVENVSYPEGTCAEAGAIAALIAGGARKIAEAVVVADGEDPISPCGGCRQRLAEFAAADTPITMVTLRGRQINMTMAELLPGAFGASQME